MLNNAVLTFKLLSFLRFLSLASSWSFCVKTRSTRCLIIRPSPRKKNVEIPSKYLNKRILFKRNEI